MFILTLLNFVIPFKSWRGDYTTEGKSEMTGKITAVTVLVNMQWRKADTVQCQTVSG